MNKYLFAGLLVSALVAGPGFAAEISDQTKCKSEVEIVRQLDAHSDVGPKFEPVVKDVIDVLEHLCEAKSFNDAEQVASANRGMLATEYQTGAAQARDSRNGCRPASFP
jgi:hypothetical protein